MSGFWSLRRRILVAIVTLLVLTVGSTMIVLYEKMKDAAARGDYLRKHLSRYLSYQDLAQGSLLAAARLVARDPAVAEALRDNTEETLLQTRKSLKKELDAAMPVQLFGLFDPYLNLKTPIGRTRILEQASKLLATVAEGHVLSTVALLSDNEAYLLAAVPVYQAEEVVGFVVLGRNLERPLGIYSSDSDSSRNKQHQLALASDGRLYSATLPVAERGDLAQALDSKHEISEGNLRVKVMELGDKTYDLHERQINAVTHEGKKVQATLTLFRVRGSYEARVTSNLYPVMYVGFGGVLAAIVIAFLLTTTITRPVRRYTKSIRQIVTGEADLTQRVDIDGDDELAALGMAINELAEKVSSLVWRIRDASLRLGQSAQEISHVSMRTLEGAQGQVTKVESSTSLTNELSRTIQEIATRASQGAQIAGLGKDSVEKTDTGMARIKEAVHQSWDKVNSLKSSVEKIGAIAELISKITEENSMLALNASIEAARAGAAGQGFAVVAQQMREQAKRVEKSSREIIENIQAIQSTTQELVNSMDDSKGDVDRGGHLVNVTLHHLSELSAIMQETAEAVKEQATASDDIAQITVDVQRIGHEALEASQQTVEEGARIREKAQELALLVGRFKVQELSAEAVQTRQLPPGPTEDEEATPSGTNA